VGETAPETEARRLAEDARDRVRFEEEALELADQVYRVARRLVSSREEAEDLMQETYARAFRSWRSFQPGTNLRAWLPVVSHGHVSVAFNEPLAINPSQIAVETPFRLQLLNSFDALVTRPKKFVCCQTVGLVCLV